MNKLSRTAECITIGRYKISRLLFTFDLVLLASSKSGLQRAPNGFTSTCDIVRIEISSSKTEVLHSSRNLLQCVFYKLAEYH